MGVDVLDIHSNRATLKQTPLPLDHRQRKAIALAVLQGANITQLAKRYGVSRKFIYTQKKKALDAINQTFTEEEKQKEKVLFEIKMTKSLLAQLILAMVLCGRSSYRGIQRIIEDVFDYHVSLGKISTIVNQASQKVAEVEAKEALDLSTINIACHDEFYVKDTPFFVAVEPASRYCFLFKEWPSCSEIGWALALKPLIEEGYAPTYVVADGGTGLRGGLHKVLADTPCYYDVFHLCREFGQAILAFRKREQGCLTSIKDIEHKIEQSKRRRDGSATDLLNMLNKLNLDLELLTDGISKLREGLGRTIHKALSLSGSYTFIERESFYTKTTNSLHNMMTSQLSLKTKVSKLYKLLCSQKDNLLGLFKRDDAIEKVRTSSMVENFHFSLRQQLRGQSSFDKPHQKLQVFYLNHRRFLAARSDKRKHRSPAELLRKKDLPHWLEMLGYQRFKQTVT